MEKDDCMGEVMAEAMGKKSLINLDERYRGYFKLLTDYIYYSSVFIFFSFSVLYSSMFLLMLTTKRYILVMAFMLGLMLMRELITCLFVKKYDVREIIGLGLCLLFWYIAEKNDSSIMMCMFMLVFGSRNVNLNKTYRIIVPVIIAISVAAYWASGEGYILEYQILEDDVYRHCFGFCYPLIVPCYIMNIAMITAVVKKEKVKWTEIGLIILFGVMFYRWCKAEMSGAFTILVALVLILMKIWPGILKSNFVLWRIIDRIAVGIYLICFFVSLWFTYFYDSSVIWMYKLNEMTGNRLSLQQNAFKDYGFKILGQKIFFVGAGLDIYGEPTKGIYNYVDNIYISILLRYGILFSVIAILLLTITMYYCYQKNMRIWLWMLSLWALHGLLEDKMHLVYYNSLLIILGPAVQNVKLSGFNHKRIFQKMRKTADSI